MKYRIHYETYVDVVADNQEDAIDRASCQDCDNELLMNIQFMDVERMED